MAKSAIEEAQKYAKAGEYAEQVMTAIRTVTAFNGQEEDCNRCGGGEMRSYRRLF